MLKLCSAGSSRARAQHSALVVALVTVAPGQVGQGRLTPWTREEDLLWNYMRRPNASVSLIITSVWRLQVPLLVTSMRGTTRNVGVQCQLFHPMTQFVLPHTVFVSGSSCRTWDDLRDSLNLELESNDIFCTWLPAPVAELVLVRAWSALLIDCCDTKVASAFNELCTELGWPDACARDGLAARASTRSELRIGALLPEQVEFALGALRRNVAHILDDGPTPEDTALRLDNCVGALEGLLSRIEERRRVSDGLLQTVSKKVHHGVEALISAFGASFQLRNRHSLFKSAKLMIDALVDAPLREHAMSLLNKAPSASSISESQVRIDAALSLVWREVLAHHAGPIFLWFDSSPQLREDWLLSIFDFIKQDDLDQAAAAAWSLQRSVASFGAAREAGQDDTLEDIVQSRDVCGQLLPSLITRHRQIPVALGSGATSLEDKCRAIAHKFMAEAKDTQECRAIMRDIRCAIVDMGVEMGASEAQGGSAASYLPVWQRGSRLRADDGVDFVDKDCPDDAVDGDFFMPNAFLSSGLDHISNNMQWDMDIRLRQWESWLRRFRAIAKLLGSRYLMQRLVARCVANTCFAPLEPVFAKAVPPIAGWRWGTICKVLPAVLEKRQALQAVWDPKKFLQGEALGGSEDDRLEVPTVTETIRSKQWWAYSGMLLKLHELANSLSSWGSGCYCHDWLRVPSGEGPIADMEKFHQIREQMGINTANDGVEYPCMMRGKRVVELASGYAGELVATISRRSTAELLVDLVDVTEVEKGEILNDFEIGKTYATMALTVKLQHWRQLPWLLVSLAHWDAERAQENARLILRTFDESPQDPRLHHRITWRWLCMGSTLRAQVEAFAQGRPLHELLELKKECQTMMFIPVCERIQEGDHSILKRHGGCRKVSGAYVSLVHRYREIERLMEQAKGRAQMVKAVVELRSFSTLAHRFHFSKHPLWLSVQGSRRHKAKVAGAIIYSTDVASMFSKHDVARQKHRHRLRTSKLAAQHWQQQFGKQPRSLWSGLMADHLRKRLVPGHLYSIPRASLPQQALCEALSSASVVHKSGGACNAVECDEVDLREHHHLQQQQQRQQRDTSPQQGGGAPHHGRVEAPWSCDGIFGVPAKVDVSHTRLPTRWESNMSDDTHVLVCVCIWC